MDRAAGDGDGHQYLVGAVAKKEGPKKTNALHALSAIPKAEAAEADAVLDLLWQLLGCQDDPQAAPEAFLKGALNAQDRKGNTPLLLACSNHRLHAAELFLSSCADVSRCNIEGFSPLTKAQSLGLDFGRAIEEAISRYQTADDAAIPGAAASSSSDADASDAAASSSSGTSAAAGKAPAAASAFGAGAMFRSGGSSSSSLIGISRGSPKTGRRASKDAAASGGGSGDDDDSAATATSNSGDGNDGSPPRPAAAAAAADASSDLSSSTASSPARKMTPVRLVRPDAAAEVGPRPVRGNSRLGSSGGGASIDASSPGGGSSASAAAADATSHPNDDDDDQEDGADDGTLVLVEEGSDSDDEGDGALGAGMEEEHWKSLWQVLEGEEVKLTTVNALVDVEGLSSAALQLAVAAATAVAEGDGGVPFAEAMKGALAKAVNTVTKLLQVVQKFSSLFDAEQKKEVLSTAIALQSGSKNLLADVKALAGDCGSDALRQRAIATAKDFVLCCYRFLRSCESGGMQYVASTAKKCADAVSFLMRFAKTFGTPGAPDAEAQETFRKATLEVAVSTVKLRQLVRARSLMHVVHEVRDGLPSLVAAVESATLELLNESHAAFVQRRADDGGIMHTLASKLVMHYREISTLVAVDNEEERVLDAAVAQARVEAARSLLQRHLEAMESAIDAPSSLQNAVKAQGFKVAAELSRILSHGLPDPEADPAARREALNSLLAISQSLSRCEVGASKILQSLPHQDSPVASDLRVLENTLCDCNLLLRCLAALESLDKTSVQAEAQLATRLPNAIAILAEFFDTLCLV